MTDRRRYELVCNLGMIAAMAAIIMSLWSAYTWSVSREINDRWEQQTYRVHELENLIERGGKNGEFGGKAFRRMQHDFNTARRNLKFMFDAMPCPFPDDPLTQEQKDVLAFRMTQCGMCIGIFNERYGPVPDWQPFKE